MQNIAIIGLGRIGSAFFGAVKRKASINLVCVAELTETPAKKQAEAMGVRIATLEEIVAMGNKIDVIFELTGNREVRKDLRERLHVARNNHTVVASETIARLIWSLISDTDLPMTEGREIGY